MLRARRGPAPARDRHNPAHSACPPSRNRPCSSPPPPIAVPSSHSSAWTWFVPPAVIPRCSTEMRMASLHGGRGGDRTELLEQAEQVERDVVFRPFSVREPCD